MGNSDVSEVLLVIAASAGLVIGVILLLLGIWLSLPSNMEFGTGRMGIPLVVISLVMILLSLKYLRATKDRLKTQE
ncbi:hypothetical protein ACFLX6_00635 [Chloroflexota bacterium]